MADNGIWFKLWVSATSDQNLDNLDISDFGRWAKFGAYLKKHGIDGKITLTDPCRILVAQFQVSSFRDVILTIQKFPNCKCFICVSSETNAPVSCEIEWLNWLKYQGDFSTHRVHRFRAKKRQSETVNVTAIEERRGEEKRGDKIRREEKNILVESDKITFDPRTGCFVGMNGKKDLWQEKFPGTDVPREIKKAEAWALANPKNRKSNWERFLVSWLTRAQDRAPSKGNEYI